MKHKIRTKIRPTNIRSNTLHKSNMFSTILLPTVVSLSLLIISSSKPVISSGVFEFELIDLQRNLDEEHSARLSQQAATHNETNSTPNSRLLICIKEAFTSQLDEPCTFGNSSLTLTGKKQQLNLDQHKLQSDSSLTNTVRIPFTFRWTRSFTLIITAEQIEPSDDQQRPSTHRSVSSLISRSAAAASLRTQQSTATNTSGDINRPLVELPNTTNNETDDGSGAATIGSSINRLLATTTTTARPQTSNHLLIDRHVLTENEVIPNLETNQVKHWSSRFSRNLKSSIAYKFRVYCSVNYYGDGCTTFCRPRDDQFGHYNCSSTGQKLCLDGWSGPDCNRAICRPGCNEKHGYCDKPDTCQCRPGWTGKRCDECIRYPGCQSGYCLSPWQCICHRNWGGVLCDLDLNYCGTQDPCKNNGTCTNVAPGRYKCQCPPGFAGVNCETNLSSVIGGSMTQLSAGCRLNPCLNGGTCFGFSSQLMDSPSGNAPPSHIESIEALDSKSGQYYDNQDPTIMMASSTPSVVAISTNVDRLYRCQCPPGWSGDYCQWPAPNSVVTVISDSNSTATNEHDLRNTSKISENSPLDPMSHQQQRSVESEDELMHAALVDLANGINNNINNSDQPRPTASTMTESSDSIPAIIEASTKPDGSHIPNMHQIISGVVIASTIGVLLAFLTIAWCCLVAIERNKLSFIQMNIIRNPHDQNNPPTVIVTTTLRRMHERIRNSFRRTTSRQHIKPDTKLNIENVLRPPHPTTIISPPSYEESKSNYLTYSSVNKVVYL